MISFLVASACVVFVLSLPISATKAGQTLRRWAGVLFLLALAPALFVGLVGAMGGSISSPHAGTGAGGGVEALGTVVGFLILSPLAYGILQLRKRFNPKSRDPWADYVDRKAAGKKVVDPKAAGKKVVDPKAAKAVLPGGTFGPFGGSP